MVFYKELFTSLKVYLVVRKTGVLTVLKPADLKTTEKPNSLSPNKTQCIIPWLINKWDKACNDNREALHHLIFYLKAS